MPPYEDQLPRSAESGDPVKTCPFCAEEVQDAAVKCKHCGSMFDAKSGVVEARPRSKTATKRSGVKAAGSLLVFIGLSFLMWGGARYMGGSSTRSLYQGTALQRNSDANTITGNAMSSGGVTMAIGVLVLGLGTFLVSFGSRAMMLLLIGFVGAVIVLASVLIWGT